MHPGKHKNWTRAGSDNHQPAWQKTECSLSEDNTQSWVRSSHGSNKFVIDSNNTENLEGQPEEQASQLNLKDFAARSKAKNTKERTC